MSWAETKYAINSSIGTDDFKPIDKMLEYEIFPSDAVALNLGSSSIKTTKEYKRIKFGIKGKCKVSFSLTGLYNFNGSVRVLNNETEIYSVASQVINNKKNFATDIFSINKNDLITIEYEKTNSTDTVNINDICILGSVLPNGTFKEVI